MKKQSILMMTLSLALLAAPCVMAQVDFADTNLNDNEADIEQLGDTNLGTVTQNGGTKNDVQSFQSAIGNNTLNVIQSGDNEGLLLNQITGAGNNSAVVNQGDGSTNNWANVSQTSALGNTLIVDQLGSSNSLVRADSNAMLNTNGSAFQNSVNGSNSLDTYQQGIGNSIGLYQNSEGNNTAVIDQIGDSAELVVRQQGQPSIEQSKVNELHASQASGDSANLLQVSGQNNGTGNFARIQQDGGNTLAGTNADGSFSSGKVAYQSTTGHNVLTLDQQGGGNKFGLTQISDLAGDNGSLQNSTKDVQQYGGDNEAGVRMESNGGENLITKFNQHGGDNDAQILQTAGGTSQAAYNTVSLSQLGGYNSLISTQTAVIGPNKLTVSQSGFDVATVSQIGNSANTFTVSQ